MDAISNLHRTSEKIRDNESSRKQKKSKFLAFHRFKIGVNIMLCLVREKQGVSNLRGIEEKKYTTLY